MCNLPLTLHALQRDCAGPYRTQRDGRLLGRRPPGQCSGSTPEVQLRKGFEKTGSTTAHLGALVVYRKLCRGFKFLVDMF